MSAGDLLARLRPLLAAAQGDVVCAYLFGSEARGTPRPQSDVDVAVLLRAVPPRTLEGRMLSLEGQLERALGRRVQLVILNDASPDLVHRVLRDGQLALERDRSARIAFEVKARNEYFDLLPVLRQYRASALARAAAQAPRSS